MCTVQPGQLHRLEAPALSDHLSVNRHINIEMGFILQNYLLYTSDVDASRDSLSISDSGSDDLVLGEPLE